MKKVSYVSRFLSGKSPYATGIQHSSEISTLIMATWLQGCGVILNVPSIAIQSLLAKNFKEVFEVNLGISLRKDSLFSDVKCWFVLLELTASES